MSCQGKGEVEVKEAPAVVGDRMGGMAGEDVEMVVEVEEMVGAAGVEGAAMAVADRWEELHYIQRLEITGSRAEFFGAWTIVFSDTV
jgi:hypothetical protein